MQERRNYYRILGIQPDAPDDIIRGVYRTLMQKLRMHPDLGGDVRDAAMINEAWRILRDPLARQTYDQTLLADYDIRQIATAGNPATQPDSGPGPNRRNYYRVLGVQSDAPQALIHSAFRTVSADNTLDQKLIAEAYRELGDPLRRSEYDAGPDASSIEEEGPDLEIPGDSKADAYKPAIRTFCVFCKTPFNAYPGLIPSASCRVCDSPLQRLDLAADSAGRSFQRHGLTETVQLYEYWPSPAIPGELTDITPDGLRLIMHKKLDAGQVVRISSSVFDAVARVIHCVRAGKDYSSGMALMTARYCSDGMIVDVKS